MSPPLPGLWNPDASAPRDGAFRTDLAHEFGHAIAARHFGVHVASITLRGLAVLDGSIRVRGACSTVWWGGLGQPPWDLAVVSAAGPVAECLERDEDPLRDPLALMRSSTEFAGDLEDVLVAAGLHHGVPAADSLAHVQTAVREAYDIVNSRLPRMRSLIERYEVEAFTSGAPTLVIPWDDELDMYFSIAPRDERPLTIAWLPGALGR
ncbi:MAG TPA: M50 family metallopeptidase [Candidatus Cybelea sp.]|jgi:hypothetical protein|nr:M50 family metallopeptidase [Candidatus Cybelea sp.]